MRQNSNMWHMKPVQSPCVGVSLGAAKCTQCCINVHACGTQSVFSTFFRTFSYILYCCIVLLVTFAKQNNNKSSKL